MVDFMGRGSQVTVPRSSEEEARREMEKMVLVLASNAGSAGELADWLRMVQADEAVVRSVRDRLKKKAG